MVTHVTKVILSLNGWTQTRRRRTARMSVCPDFSCVDSVRRRLARTEFRDYWKYKKLAI